MRHITGVIFLFLLSTRLFADTEVTSREQFTRLMPGGLPDQLRYDDDGAALEIRADDKNCPLAAHGFFELKINSAGEVTRTRDVSLSRSVLPKVMSVTWVKSILMQIRFRPLKFGSKATSVRTFTTVFCR